MGRMLRPRERETMKFNPDIHHRRSIRLHGYDYADSGAYFVTVCVQGRECLFGEVMELNGAGRMVEDWWAKLPERFPSVVLDQFVVMPNHFHGIVVIAGSVGAGSPRPISPDIQDQGGETPPLRKPTLGQIVGYFKYQTTKQFNAMRDDPGVPLWQRNYYERVIRHDDELGRARRYIAENPLKWGEDRENPANVP